MFPPLIFHCNTKPLASGPCVGLHPQRDHFALPIPTCYLKTLKFALLPTQNPNASQWKIGSVGYQTQNFRVDHVHFMFFVLISFAFGGQHKPSFQWNMGFILLSALSALSLASYYLAQTTKHSSIMQRTIPNL